MATTTPKRPLPASADEDEAPTQPMAKKARTGPQWETFVIREEEDNHVLLFDRASTAHSARILEAFITAQKVDAASSRDLGHAFAFINYITSVLKDEKEEGDGEDEEVSAEFEFVPSDILKLTKEELGTWKIVSDPTLPGVLPSGIHFPRASW